MRQALGWTRASRCGKAAAAAARFVAESGLGAVPAHGLAAVMQERPGILVPMVDAGDGIVGHGMLLAEIRVERRDGGKLASNCGRREFGRHERLAPGDHVRALHRPEGLRVGDPGERAEFEQVAPVGAPRMRVAEVGQPLVGGGHGLERVEGAVGQGHRRESR